ncbi:MAG: FAD:protein FMN transferase [Pirellulales bacterium]|nr:FAD:protein FMN transferase [Pirellulales bacterium]
MGTSYTVKLVTDSHSIDNAEIREEIRKTLDEINARMSTYDPDSELSRWNDAETTDWFPVSEETAAVTAEAIRIGRVTEGAFDVTLDPLVRLWQFGPRDSNLATEKDTDRIPNNEEIKDTLQLVGFSQIESRTNPPAVRKRKARIRVDLSGIAKGYGVDRMAELLKHRGFENYMVEIGGEIRASGHNLAGRPWRIGIESPKSGTREIDSIVDLGTRAMATSGDYRNYFEKDGVRYSHLLDPRNGRPISHRLASVTVLAETCAEADALATGLMVLGPDTGFDLARSPDFESRGIAAAFIVRNDDGFVQKKTANWPLADIAEKTEPASTGASMITAFLAALIVLAAAMLALSIGPIIRKRKMQCSCKTARQIMKATDPRHKKPHSSNPKTSPLLPILPNDSDDLNE